MLYFGFLYCVNGSLREDVILFLTSAWCFPTDIYPRPKPLPRPQPGSSDNGAGESGVLRCLPEALGGMQWTISEFCPRARLKYAEVL